MKTVVVSKRSPRRDTSARVVGGVVLLTTGLHSLKEKMIQMTENDNDTNDPFAVPHRPERQRVRKTEPMAESIPHAKVDVIAPDGTIEDSVIVRFDYKQPLGIDPTEWMERGYFGDEYKLELVYVSTGNEFITERTESQNDKQT